MALSQKQIDEQWELYRKEVEKRRAELNKEEERLDENQEWEKARNKWIVEELKKAGQK